MVFRWTCRLRNSWPGEKNGGSEKVKETGQEKNKEKEKQDINMQNDAYANTHYPESVKYIQASSY